MPMVDGKKYSYDKEGRMAAKKAAIAKMRNKGKKKQNWSGAKSQLGY